MECQPNTGSAVRRRRPVRRRLVAAVVLAAGTAALVGWRVAWPAVELHRAATAADRHDLAAARGRLDRYLAHWPDDVEALSLAARTARQADAYAEAERYLTDWERLSGSTEASKLEWMLLGAQQGDFAGQEDHLQLLVKENHPDSTAILLALARGYSVCYRRREATQSLDALLRRQPDNVPALLVRGALWESVRNPESARDDFRHAVEVSPECAVAHAALARWLQRNGHSQEAIDHFELSRQLQPADSTPLLGLARALQDAAQLTAAQVRLDELLAVDPDNADGLVERGRVALRQGRPDEARPFLARSPAWHRDGQRLYGTVLKELGHTEEAAACTAHLAELRAEDGLAGRWKLRAHDAPTDTGVRLELWQWSVRNGQVQEGLAWLTEILRVAPKHARAHLALAEYFEWVGQPRRAALHRKAASGAGETP